MVLPADSPIPTEYFLVVSAALFCIGVAVMITRRHAIVVLMGLELILNAANLNLVVFGRNNPGSADGQLFALFVIVVAAAEAAVALAILLKAYRYFRTTNLDDIRQMKH